MGPKVLRDRPGMLVIEGGGVAHKIARSEEDAHGLQNAWRFLQALKDTPFVPTPWELVEGHLLRMEYIEETPITDTELARRYAIQLINVLRQRNIVHGDLTDPNIIFRDNVPVAIDWDQSNFAVSEVRPQKRPKPDIVHLMPVLIDKVGDPSRVVRRWQGLRDAISYYFGWGTFLDLGTHMGDFCGLAAAEGMKASGVDAELIRPCIDEAKRLWGQFGCEFRKADIVPFVDAEHIRDAHWNVIMLFSTWAYIYNRDNRDGLRVLHSCIQMSDVFLFETQLAGDGPGPEFLKTKEDVIQLLYDWGGATEVEELITIPVEDRPAERTIWKVT